MHSDFQSGTFRDQADRLCRAMDVVATRRPSGIFTKGGKALLHVNCQHVVSGLPSRIPSEAIRALPRTGHRIQNVERRALGCAL
jgi:hypothetical protein